MPKLNLTLLCPQSAEERLLDMLLDAVRGALFTSVPTFTHGAPQGRLTNVEQVLGRSAAVQMQIVVDEDAIDELLQRLRAESVGVGLRYWATPLALDGEIA